MTKTQTNINDMIETTLIGIQTIELVDNLAGQINRPTDIRDSLVELLVHYSDELIDNATSDTVQCSVALK